MYKYKKVNNKYNYVSLLITRLLVATILLFVSIIYTNKSSYNNKLFKKYFLSNNISFSKVYNLYNKYLGNLIPIKDNVEEKTVFNEKIEYNDIKVFNNGYELYVNNNYLVPVINSGLVVFIGDRDGKKSVIVQGVDEIDYVYSNITNLNVKMYDYISKGKLLGNSMGDKLYLTFLKDGKYLKYDEVFK